MSTHAVVVTMLDAHWIEAQDATRLIAPDAVKDGSGRT